MLQQELRVCRNKRRHRAAAMGGKRGWFSSSMVMLRGKLKKQPMTPWLLSLCLTQLLLTVRVSAAERGEKQQSPCAMQDDSSQQQSQHCHNQRSTSLHPALLGNDATQVTKGVALHGTVISLSRRSLQESQKRQLHAAAAEPYLTSSSSHHGGSSTSSEAISPTSRFAYVTLLYSEDFLLGVRVLGQSLRESSTPHPMLVLTTPGVSSRAKQLLQLDGWEVHQLPLVKNPNSHFPSRFWGVYTKLNIFNLTTFSRVVYLDADVVVLQNIDELFSCRGFCANLKHSERFNSGVMVIEPSAELFQKMKSDLASLPSYTGGDQGFLNSFFPLFPDAPFFIPPPSSSSSSSSPSSSSLLTPPLQRLSTIYNADVGLFMLANKWMLDPSSLRVLHFTLGPLKPWDWWSAWLLIPTKQWQDYRYRLPRHLEVASESASWASSSIAQLLLAMLPLLLLLSMHHKPLMKCALSQDVFGKSRQQASNLLLLSSYLDSPCRKVNLVSIHILSTTAAAASAVAAAALAFALLPSQVGPWTGLLLLLEWTVAVFVILFGLFLSWIRHWARSIACQGQAHGYCFVAQVWDFPSLWLLILGISSVFVIILSPFVFGISSLFARIGIYGALVPTFMCFFTLSSVYVGERWFLLGTTDTRKE